MSNNLKTYNTFSGLDIYAIFEDVVFGEIQMVSYKIDREKAPVYTMGSPDLRSIARGKRLVTGACVFVVFDRDSLLSNLAGTASYYPALDIADTANLGNENAVYQAGTSESDYAGIPQASVRDAGADASLLKQVGAAQLADQLLAFDITLVGANEYGATTKMVIHGVELMSEASGVSIDDLVIEKQFSFIARRVTNWTAGTAIKNSAVDNLTS